MYEQSSGRSAALTQMPAAEAATATSWSASDPGRRDHQAHPDDVVRLERAPSERFDMTLVDLGGHRRRHLRGDDADDRPGRGEAGDLAGGDRAGTDDEDRDAVEVEGDRVAKPRSHRPRVPVKWKFGHS